jgi:hypothetical protein
MDIGELGGTRRPTALNRPKWQIPIEWFGPRGAGPCLSGGLFIHIRDKIINTIQVSSLFDYGSWLLAALQFVLQ